MASPKLPTRKICAADVTAIRYGAMGIAAAYGDVLTEEERFKVPVVHGPDTLHELGCTNWDTVDIYLDSEDLIGAWWRNDNFLANKFGFIPDPDQPVNGDPAYVQQAFERFIKRLGVDYFDLYYLYCADPAVPIEVTVRAMAELVRSMLFSAEIPRRAHAVHPVAAIQVEYSPVMLDIEDDTIGVLKTARELGVAVVAYSPLGRGFLTGKYRTFDGLPADDYRRTYQPDNFPSIVKLADGLAALERKRRATAGQERTLSPSLGPRRFPCNLKENLGALDVKLSPEDVQEVRRIAQAMDATHGDRYPTDRMQYLFADTPPLQK
ncbi:Aldo/keto reductase [Dichomitus squalens]|nr:Aldo/keto reductase [Dichomitus squalens]